MKRLLDLKLVKIILIAITLGIWIIIGYKLLYQPEHDENPKIKSTVSHQYIKTATPRLYSELSNSTRDPFYPNYTRSPIPVKKTIQPRISKPPVNNFVAPKTKTFQWPKISYSGVLRSASGENNISVLLVINGITGIYEPKDTLTPNLFINTVTTDSIHIQHITIKKESKWLKIAQ